MWSLTPREYAALKRQHRDSLAPWLSMHAAIQATLHNAHFQKDGGGRWSQNDFMPKQLEATQVEPEPTWKRTMMILREQFTAARDKFRKERERG